MHLERRILANTTFLGGGEAVGQMATFLFVLLFARRFGPDVLGLYSLTMAIGAIVGVFVTLGLHELLISDIARQPEKGRSLIGVMLPVESTSSLVLLVFVVGVAGVYLQDEQARVILVAITAYHIVMRVTSLLLVRFAANEQMALAAFIAGGHRLMILVAGSAAIFMNLRPDLVLLVFPVAAAASALLAWRRDGAVFGRVNLRLDLEQVVSYVGRAAPLFALGLLNVIFVRAGLILLASIEDASSVGIYAVADRLVVPLGVGPVLFVTAVYPALARIFNEAPAKFEELAARCLRLMLVLIIPCAAIIVVLSEDIVSFLFGKAFLAAVPALQLLTVALIFQSVNQLWSVQVLAIDSRAMMMSVRGVAVAILILSAAILVHWKGFVGLAYATLLASGIQSILLFIVLARKNVPPTIFQSLLAPAISFLAVMFCGWLFDDQSFWTRLPTIIFVAALSLWLFRGIRLHDLRFLMRIVRSKGA